MDVSIQEQTPTKLEERYEVLLRVSQTIRAHRDGNALLNNLPRELSRVLQWDLLGITLHDERTRTMQPFELKADGSRFDDYLAQHFAPEETLSWWVYQNQQPLVIARVAKETRFPRLMQFFESNGIQSACCVPLTAIHRCLGGLSVANKQPDAYAEEEVRFLSLVANQIALAIEDTLNFQASEQAQADLQRERDQLRLLLELNNSIAASLERRDLLPNIVAAIRHVMKTAFVGIYLPDSERKMLRLYADRTATKAISKQQSAIRIDELRDFPPVRVFQSGQAFVTADISSDRRQAESYLPTVDNGVHSWCMFPLKSGRRVLGVLVLGREGESSFSHEEVEFLKQAIIQVALAIENGLTYRQSVDDRDQLAVQKSYLENEIRSEMHFGQIVGKSAAIRLILDLVSTVARTDSTILIVGETGTGKELIARAIHNASRRKDRTFVKLNCAAIPTGLLESELFGHEKGAFTGAISQRIGRFELANHGTIFLDEIGEISLDLQPKLLRVLQDQEFERLGGSRTLRTDARLIAATNRDLNAMMAENKFRADLYYRLNVFPIRVPPLRERKEDIPLLARHFTEQLARKLDKTITSIADETIRRLMAYDWPGNIRELLNVIERAAILSPGPELAIPIFDLKERSTSDRVNTSDTLEEAERKHILAVLNETNWTIGGASGAAARLGIKRSTLQFRMKKLGIERPKQIA